MVSQTQKKGRATAPASVLTEEQKHEIVAEVLGVHPKYLIYDGLNIKVDLYRMTLDGVAFTDFPLREKVWW